MLPVETTAARPTGTGGGNLSSGVISSSRSEEHTSELQSQSNLVCRLLLEKKKKAIHIIPRYSSDRTRTFRIIAAQDYLPSILSDPHSTLGTQSSDSRRYR